MGFLICASCARHVKDAEAACPFCGGSLASANRAGNPGRIARNRFAILFGASTAIAVGTTAIACGDDSSTSSSYDGGPHGVDAAYGGPFVGVDAAYGGPFVGVDAAYGGPEIEDAGSDAGASDASTSDSSDDAGD